MEQHQRKQEESTVADDPKAREMLRQAFEKTARWQKDFKGFTADLIVNVNGKEASGPVMVKGPREVSVQLSDADVQKWVQEQLGMIAVHRGPRTFEESDGKYSLTMEEGRTPVRHETYHPRVELVLSAQRQSHHPDQSYNGAPRHAPFCLYD